MWNGRAILKGGYELEWTVMPLTSLARFGLAAEWTLVGGDSRLAGRALLRPNSATLDGVEGRAGWGLARLALPGLTLECDGSAAMTLARVVLERDRQGAEGAIRTGPAVCVDAASPAPQAVEAPPLTAVATMDDAASFVSIATVADPATRLADLSVRDRVLVVTIHPAGARLVGSLPASGPITLEYPF